MQARQAFWGRDWQDFLATLNKGQRSNAAVAARWKGDTLGLACKSLPIRMAITDKHWRILASSDSWEEGARRDGFEACLGIGHNYALFCAAYGKEINSRGRQLLSAIEAMGNGELEQFELQYEAPQGEQRQVSIVSCHTDGQRFIVISYYDAEDDPATLREQVALAGLIRGINDRIGQIQEEERRRIAREFHDSSAQYLTGINLALARLGQMDCAPEVRAITGDIATMLDDFHRDLRGLTYALHPPELQKCGFQGAIRSLCAGLERRTNLTIRLSMKMGVFLTPLRAQSAIYRVIQEALINVHRHAHAKAVRVRISDLRSGLIAVVTDDGMGLPGRAADIPKMGVGIPGMIARITELGGHCVVRNCHGRSGTFVGAAIPQSLPLPIVGTRPSLTVVPD